MSGGIFTTESFRSLSVYAHLKNLRGSSTPYNRYLPTWCNFRAAQPKTWAFCVYRKLTFLCWATLQTYFETKKWTGKKDLIACDVQNLLRKYILVQRCASHFVLFYSWVGEPQASPRAGGLGERGLKKTQTARKRCGDFCTQNFLTGVRFIRWRYTSPPPPPLPPSGSCYSPYCSPRWNWHPSSKKLRTARFLAVPKGKAMEIVTYCLEWSCFNTVSNAASNHAFPQAECKSLLVLVISHI